MRCSLISLLVIIISFTVNSALSQKRLVVMGSSTAAGTGASPYSNCWVSKTQAYYRQNMSDNLDTVVINIAQGGQTTYNQLPNGLAAVANRPWPPDTARNVNKALSFSPDVVIINLPSNDVASGFSKEEVMANFRMMYSTIVAAGVKCFITTTQPRTLSDIARQMQRSLVDSINNVFGQNSINFWNDIATYDGSNYIRADVSANDGVHVNNAGHNFLFVRVRDRGVFSSNVVLPVKLTDFQARFSNNTALISWHTEQEDPNTFYELQRSAGPRFETLYRQAALLTPRAAYSWTDQHPLTGKSFYRLRITESGRESFSKTVSINNKAGGLNISRLYSDQTSANLFAEIDIQKSQPVEISIITATGAALNKQSQFVSGPSCWISLPISGLASGVYFLSIKTSDNRHAVKTFSKLPGR